MVFYWTLSFLDSWVWCHASKVKCWLSSLEAETFSCRLPSGEGGVVCLFLRVLLFSFFCCFPWDFCVHFSLVVCLLFSGRNSWRIPGGRLFGGIRIARSGRREQEADPARAGVRSSGAVGEGLLPGMRFRLRVDRSKSLVSFSELKWLQTRALLQGEPPRRAPRLGAISTRQLQGRGIIGDGRAVELQWSEV